MRGALPKFPRRPAATTTLGAKVGTATTLKPTPATRYFDFEWWPFLVHSQSVDLLSDRSAMQRWEDPAEFSLLIETCCRVESRNPARYRALKLSCQLTFKAAEDADDEFPLWKEPPVIVGAWPKDELAPPVNIARGITSKDQFGIEIGHKPGKITAGLDISEHWEQKFPCHLTRRSASVSSPRNPRRVTFEISATETRPSLAGQHRAGVWISHTRQCYLRVSARVDVQASIDGKKTPLEPFVTALSEPFRFVRPGD